ALRQSATFTPTVQTNNVGVTVCLDKNQERATLTFLEAHHGAPNQIHSFCVVLSKGLNQLFNQDWSGPKVDRSMQKLAR
ncbi:MAG: hypothetical protein N4A70_04955, partial [Pelagimonas sp.]|nr:hypothetical protein [Pelagimonas sp.]